MLDHINQQIDRFFTGSKSDDKHFVTSTALELSDLVISGENLTWTSPEETRTINDDAVLEALYNNVEFNKALLDKALNGKAEPFARMQYNLTLLALIEESLTDFCKLPMWIVE